MLIDPTEVARRWAAPPVEERVEPDEDAPDFESQAGPLLARIPAPEAEIVRLYFVAQKSQRAIASIYGVSQAAISYRLHRAIRRLRFLASLPSVDEVTMRAELGAVLAAVDVDIVVAMWRSTCQTLAATRLGLGKGALRQRFVRAARKIVEAAAQDEKLAPYRDLVEAITGSRLILFEKRHSNFVYPEAA